MDNARMLFDMVVKDGHEAITRMRGFKEESLFIDFKRKSKPSTGELDDSDKKNYAKALSAFSNSSGGVIIWGVDARKSVKTNNADLAGEELPIKPLRTFLTNLNSFTGEALAPANTGIINEAIYLNSDQSCDEGFIITYVPESDLPPHKAMIGEKDYYIRVADRSAPMEHYMLADAFGRRQKPKLELYYTVKYIHTGGYAIILGLENQGKYLAKSPAIRIKLDSNLYFQFDRQKSEFITVNLKAQGKLGSDLYSKEVMFIGRQEDLIHPGTFMEVIIASPNQEWRGDVNLERLSDENGKLVIECELYAEGAEMVRQTLEIDAQDLLDKLEINSKKGSFKQIRND